MAGRPRLRKDGFLFASAMAFFATLQPVGVVGRTGRPSGRKFVSVIFDVGFVVAVVMFMLRGG
ncbi:hypothetical protein PG985_013901 [Apiospora marii]|uniref:Uncharacterized protein n=1 Tax=Apiospora marii TaxID=335849 RepID=A0ABR1R6H2_9PEZI